MLECGDGIKRCIILHRLKKYNHRKENFYNRVALKLWEQFDSETYRKAVWLQCSERTDKSDQAECRS